MNTDVASFFYEVVLVYFCRGIEDSFTASPTGVNVLLCDCAVSHFFVFFVLLLEDNTASTGFPICERERERERASALRMQ